MRVSSVRSVAGSRVLVTYPLDAKIVAARLGVAHVDVRDVTVLKQPLNLGLGVTI